MKITLKKQIEKTKNKSTVGGQKKNIFGSTKKILLVLSSLVLIANLGALSYGVYAVYVSYQTLQDEREFREKELYRWEELTEVYSHSPDVFYNTAIAALRIDEKKKALFYTEKALILDPAFAEAITLKEGFFGD